MEPVSVLSAGLTCSVGLEAPAAFAAIRSGINAAAETKFIDRGGEWIQGCAVPLETPVRGLARLAALAAPAVSECLRAAEGAKPETVPVLLCLSEPERPGRPPGLEGEILPKIAALLGRRLHECSAVLPSGRVGIARGLTLASGLLRKERVPYCVLAGVDSLLSAPAILAFQERNALLTSRNSDGFIPGEAGAAVLLGLPKAGRGPQLICRGVGFGSEPEGATVVRSDGLVAAIRNALQDAGASFEEIDYRIADVSGRQRGFKEAALAIGRTVRRVKPRFELWHPADCIGEVGAAIGPCILGAALTASRKAYAPGPGVLCHFGNDDGARAAVVVRYQEVPK